MTAQTPARRVSAARSKARTPKKVKGRDAVACRRPDCLADADRTEPREASLGVKSLRVHPIDAERIDGFAERRHEIVQPFRSRHRCGRPRTLRSECPVMVAIAASVRAARWGRVTA